MQIYLTDIALSIYIYTNKHTAHNHMDKTESEWDGHGFALGKYISDYATTMFVYECLAGYVFYSSRY